MSTRSRVILLAVASMFCCASVAAPIVAVTETSLLRFDSATPGTVTAGALTGIGAGETVVGIDRRPATLEVFVLTRAAGGFGRLYVLDTLSGVASLRGTLDPDPADLTAPYTGLIGTRFAVDFNPVVDRLRVVNNDDQNLRIGPATQLVLTDDATNPGDPTVVGAAYINNQVGTPTTVLYTLDAQSDSLAIQSPPNNGTQVLIGPLGVDFTDGAAFDIASDMAPNAALAALRVAGTTGLYAINLETGGATLIGNIFGNPDIVGMTISDFGIVFSSGFE